MDSFIGTSIFQVKADLQREEKKVLSWMNLPQRHVYKITKVETVENTKYGTAYILFLIDIKKNKCKVWSSRKLIKELQEKDDSDIPYIMSLGQEPYGHNSTINSYDLVYDKGEKVYSIFSSPPPLFPEPEEKKLKLSDEVGGI